jgi:hypothetical protein
MWMCRGYEWDYWKCWKGCRGCGVRNWYLHLKWRCLWHESPLRWSMRCRACRCCCCWPMERAANADCRCCCRGWLLLELVAAAADCCAWCNHCGHGSLCYMNHCCKAWNWCGPCCGWLLVSGGKAGWWCRLVQVLASVALSCRLWLLLPPVAAGCCVCC